MNPGEGVRYVREWLACLGCGGIIEIAPGPTYWISAENAKVWLLVIPGIQALNREHCEPVTLIPSWVEFMARSTDYVVEAFKKDGPYGATQKRREFRGF